MYMARSFFACSILHVLHDLSDSAVSTVGAKLGDLGFDYRLDQFGKRNFRINNILLSFNIQGINMLFSVTSEFNTKFVRA